MTIYFILPKIRHRSGGSLYNSKIIEYFALPHKVIFLETIPPKIVGELSLPVFKKSDVCVIDGFLLPGLCDILDQFPEIIVFVHSLPSLEFSTENCLDHPRIKKLITTGKYLSDHLNHSIILEPGINHVEIKPIGLKERVRNTLLCVGVLSPLKNQIDGIKLIELLAEECVLILAGDANNDYAGNLRNVIKTRGLEQKVKILGELEPPTLYAKYRTSHLLVSFSHFESFGMGILEAMACGLPTVALSAGNLSQTIGDTGYVVNDIEEMVRKINSILNNDDEWNLLSSRCIEKVSSHPSWESQARRLEEEILGGDSITHSTNWLYIRKVYDDKARNKQILQRFINFCKKKHITQYYDIGAGYGHNSLFLSTYITWDSTWYLIERDISAVKEGIGFLKSILPEFGYTLDIYGNEITAFGNKIEKRFIFIQDDIFSFLSSENTGIIVCNALLDILSPQMVKSLFEYQLPIYATLTYTGMEISSQGSEKWVEFYNSHMKKSGHTGAEIGKLLSSEIDIAFSNWTLGSGDEKIMELIIKYMEDAIPDLISDTTEFEQWLKGVRGDLHNGDLRIIVRHIDLLRI